MRRLRRTGEAEKEDLLAVQIVRSRGGASYWRSSGLDEVATPSQRPALRACQCAVRLDGSAAISTLARSLLYLQGAVGHSPPKASLIVVPRDVLFSLSCMYARPCECECGHRTRKWGQSEPNRLSQLRGLTRLTHPFLTTPVDYNYFLDQFFFFLLSVAS